MIPHHPDADSYISRLQTEGRFDREQILRLIVKAERLAVHMGAWELSRAHLLAARQFLFPLRPPEASPRHWISVSER